MFTSSACSHRLAHDSLPARAVCHTTTDMPKTMDRTGKHKTGSEWDFHWATAADAYRAWRASGSDDHNALLKRIDRASRRSDLLEQLFF